MDRPLDRYHAPQWLGAEAKRRFHVMAKPAGSACNLDCGYCFYLSKPALAGGPGAGHMDDEVLELFVRQYIAGVTGDEVVFSWQGGEPTLRGLDFFRKGVAVEHDGTVYACDHYVYPEYRLGDLQSQTTLADMVFSPTQVRFGYAKSETLPRHCRECEFLSDCWGECPKNRLLRAPDGEPGVNYLCRGLKRFYRHAVPQAERIAAQLRATRVATGFDT